MTILELSAFKEVKNPFTHAWERPRIFLDHFAKGVHGLKFECGTIYNLETTTFKAR